MVLSSRGVAHTHKLSHPHRAPDCFSNQVGGQQEGPGRGCEIRRHLGDNDAGGPGPDQKGGLRWAVTRRQAELMPPRVQQSRCAKPTLAGTRYPGKRKQQRAAQRHPVLPAYSYAARSELKLSPACDTPGRDPHNARRPRLNTMPRRPRRRTGSSCAHATARNISSKRTTCSREKGGRTGATPTAYTQSAAKAAGGSRCAWFLAQTDGVRLMGRVSEWSPSHKQTKGAAGHLRHS